MSLSDTPSGPGRPREFEIDAAVESAMQVFWTRGYHGTSLVDLIDGTGLSRGSLYKAFGDKHGLFLFALDRYISQSLVRLLCTLQKPGSAKAAIRETVTRLAELSCKKEGRRGCMLVATATEMVPHDDAIAERVNAMIDRIRHAYAEAIVRGQASGEIAPHHDAQALATLIVCLTHGMRTLGKVGAVDKQINALVDSAMRLLD
ncbi:TetR/AcrR family transcriptional regulator [Herbaspirillum sp. WKF16]|uniref:TetR/AcrR family transcriptional regulator n=1 Tax=Herbaspirillum sp. WKF16 TaxID=3028312 RepID=UPI0023A973A2|nr:TetR/AcrR family transcriptional regulator [Herbaspirillum sp. WKF16]WDZ96726.1 TetR/AcrR family transcriptional regulator [Herbaspirillum sp. WKF16]